MPFLKSGLVLKVSKHFLVARITIPDFVLMSPDGIPKSPDGVLSCRNCILKSRDCDFMSPDSIFKCPDFCLNQILESKYLSGSLDLVLKV